MNRRFCCGAQQAARGHNILPINEWLQLLPAIAISIRLAQNLHAKIASNCNIEASSGRNLVRAPVVTATL
jgi:hypothetical protein